MIAEGQIILFKFPQTDQQQGKLRPALILRKLPGRHIDWLICMISSQVHQEIPELDETVTTDNSDFVQTGLKSDSVIRVSRLAVVEERILLGSIGQISSDRLAAIKQKIAKWITGKQTIKT